LEDTCSQLFLLVLGQALEMGQEMALEMGQAPDLALEQRGSAGSKQAESLCPHGGGACSDASSS